jgi:predicted house-cleaning noncanonical NTP pyrophosphatase (MazG superfamily)
MSNSDSMLQHIEVICNPASRTHVSDRLQFGRKAAGLMEIPNAWTLPYFIVSSEFIGACRIVSKKKRISLIGLWVDALRKGIQDILQDPPLIIIRSSGKRENIDARGRYSSKISELKNLKSDILRYVEDFLANQAVKDDDISLIVQEYRKPSHCGHLSNERRCYREGRDWLGEISGRGNIPPSNFQVNIRSWRDGKANTNAISHPLACRMEANLVDVLRASAMWASSNGYRLHFEWVWDGDTVWLVQADADDSTEAGEDPTSRPRIRSSKTHKKFEVLVAINPKEHSKYKKIENAIIYRQLNLPNSELYLLDDQKVITDLSNGDLSERLIQDINILVSYPVIIRCDIVSPDLRMRQMLPRTDEKRNSKEVCDWLLDTASQLFKEGYSDLAPAFIFHHFIPADASAFVYVEPGNREVLIEALWGLPEGLYYNAHDKYVVDTGSSDIAQVKKRGEAGVIHDLDVSFKPSYIAPDCDGRWVSRRLRQPFDWKSSIQQTSLIAEIAICARLICEDVGKAISVMWFIGIDADASGATHMPWHHEEAAVSELRNVNTGVRRKTVFDQDFVIRTESDLDGAEKLILDSNGKIAQIKVQPMEDRLLRDKKLLEEVGFLAKKLQVPILLEGGILSHAYYQLVATGAAVEIAHPFNRRSNLQEFNKLVRDKIPATIARFGESVRLAKVEKEALLVALKDKLVEEAFEVSDSNQNSDLVQELGDVYVILRQILTTIGVNWNDFEEIQGEKTEKRGGFRDGLILLETSLARGKDDSAQGNLFQDEGLAPVVINKDQYAALARVVDMRSDLRVGDGRREILRQVWIPIASPKWDGETKSVLTRLGGDEVIGKVSLWREGARLRVDLRIEIFDREGEILNLK